MQPVFLHHGNLIALIDKSYEYCNIFVIIMIQFE